jgi:hypothetical protein
MFRNIFYYDYITTKQDRQSTYNVTRTVLATIVAVEEQQVLHNLSVFICSLRYQECNAHAPFCHLWSVPLNNIFPHFFIKDSILEKKLLKNKMFALIFSTIFFPNISHYKKN